MSGFFDAVTLLTRVPARSGARPERAVAWLSLIGALIGVAVAAVYGAARGAVGPLPAAVLAVAAGILLTGALHEDGLADTADAFGAGAGRDETLAILKDPRHGTYGVLALALSVVARVAAVATLTGWGALAALPSAHALSRAGAAWMIARRPVATPDGLATTYAGPAAGRGARIAAGTAGLVAAGLLGPWAAAAAATVVAAVWVTGRLAEGKIGGITGDVLGAAQQLGEIGVLLVAAASGDGVPWKWH